MLKPYNRKAVSVPPAYETTARGAARLGASPSASGSGAGYRLTGSARTAARVTGIGVASSKKKATKEAAPISYARIAVVGCAKTWNTVGCA